MKLSSRIQSGAASLFLALLVLPAGLPSGAAQAADMHMAPTAMGVRTSYHRYTVPPIALTDQFGHSVPLAKVLTGSSPVLVQFFFATCTTICGVRSAQLVAAAPRLVQAGVHMAFYSISIDPDHDTPSRLLAYSKEFGATPPNWHLLTGTLPEVRQVQAAFDASDPSADKMMHLPLTFLRAGKNQPWLRINGMMSERELLHMIESDIPAQR